MFDVHDVRIETIPKNGGISRVSTNIKLYSPASAGPVDWFGKSVTVYDGEPEILELDDVYFNPSWLCLYDKFGALIPETCLQWGSRSVDVGPEVISIPKDPITIYEPVVYLCDIRNHWGHFLTDGVSRMWAHLRFPELAKLRSFVISTPRLDDRIVDFLCAIKLDPWRNIFSYVKFSPQMLHFRKIFIPSPSFSLYNYAYTLHYRNFAQVTNRYIPSFTLTVDASPVYLSRSKSKFARTVRNEIEFENELIKRNFRIVYPEYLSLIDQILMFNHSSHIFGCWGSAFYNMLFSNNPGQITTHIFCGPWPYKDFLALDTILGNKSNYVRAMKCVSETEQLWEVDIDACLSYISSNIF